ncbi:MAG: hypothetical protein P8P88_04145 [Polaribacter sp.]|nr:hypothetical protein [Polaribacter sp.]
MKIYNSTNFFKHTFCEFTQIVDFNFPENNNYKSKSESQYFYTKKGVYRKSNHWGRVANCRWKIITNNKYKNQTEIIGFAKWSDFFPINSSKNNFFITVDFENKTVRIKPKKDNTQHTFFTYSQAQKKIKKINNLLLEDKWATYFDININILRHQIISEYINSNKTLAEIKQSFK